jgi:YesN/AraC family two-component response regulator
LIYLLISIILILNIVTVGLTVTIFNRFRKKEPKIQISNKEDQFKKEIPITHDSDKSSIYENNIDVDNSSDELYHQIVQAINKQKLFLKSDIRLNYLAKLLDSNNSYISREINKYHEGGFTELINKLRVEYATMLIANKKGANLESIAKSSGFNSNASFFRAFKGFIGQTPKEYRNSLRRKK